MDSVQPSRDCSILSASRADAFAFFLQSHLLLPACIATGSDRAPYAEKRRMRLTRSLPLAQVRLLLYLALQAKASTSRKQDCALYYVNVPASGPGNGAIVP